MCGKTTPFVVLVLFVLDAGLTQDQTTTETQERIVGGMNARQGEVPYQILLRERGRFVCGGSLVIIKRQQVILTAAHCVTDGRARDFSATAGALNRHYNSGRQQVRRISRIVAHENFTRIYSLPNDIAILFLESPFILNRYVAPIHLPRRRQQTRGDVIASGWGRNIPGRRFPPAILQTVRIPIVDDDTCRRAFSRIPRRILPSHICAGLIEEGGRGTCFGDSGGPLRSVRGGYLVGIASWVVNKTCVPPGFPVVNTEVSHFIFWLNQNVPDVNVGTSSELD